jgi:hypothetical protein
MVKTTESGGIMRVNLETTTGLTSKNATWKPTVKELSTLI